MGQFLIPQSVTNRSTQNIVHSVLARQRTANYMDWNVAVTLWTLAAGASVRKEFKPPEHKRHIKDAFFTLRKVKQIMPKIITLVS